MSEDYYTYTIGTGVCEKNSYTINKNSEGKFELSIKRRGNIRDEEGIYYLKIGKGVFVFKVKFKI